MSLVIKKKYYYVKDRRMGFQVLIHWARYLINFLLKSKLKTTPKQKGRLNKASASHSKNLGEFWLQR